MRIPYQSTIHAALSAAILCSLLLSGCNLPTPTTPTLVEDTQATSTNPTPTATFLPTPRAHAEQLVTPPGKIVEPTSVALPATDPGRQPGESIFGVSVAPLNKEGGLLQAAEARLFWTRVDLNWRSVEPVQGMRAWENLASFEEKARVAAQAGMKVIMILGDTPDWALKEGFNCGPMSQENFASFANFAKDVVERYSQPPYNVRYWEIFNEPDAPGFLGCWGDPGDKSYYGGGYYGEMMKVVYPAMKSANPDAQVLVGGLLMDCDPVNPPDLANQPGQKKDCTSGKFFEGILASGAGGALDGVAFHSYDYYVGYGDYNNPNWNSSRLTTGSSSVVKAAYLRSVLDQYKVTGRYLVNTEYALFCGRENSTNCDSFINEVEATKAYYTVQFMANAMAGAYQTAIWYAVFYGRNNSLLNKDFSPKPVFHAMEFTDTLLGRARFIQTLRDQNFTVQVFERAGKTIWAVWTLDNQSHTLDLPSTPASIFVIGPDGQAHEAQPDTKITLDVEPAFVLFQ